MIYDPITRQSVVIIGRYKPQKTAYKFGEKITGSFRYVKARYGEHLPGFSGGFVVGEERDVELNNLVADEGVGEIEKAYREAAEIK